VATLDGADFGQCNADRRQPGNICIKAKEIHSGPHVLELLLDPLSSSYFTSVVKFTAGMTGDWVFDLKAVALSDAKDSDYFAVHERLAAIDGCDRALARVTALSSCSLDSVGALAPALVRAAAACSATAKNDAAVNALAEIVDDHFGLTAGQCCAKAERKTLPGRLVDNFVEDGIWPENTLTTGSWAWARDVLPKISAKADIREVLDKLQAALADLHHAVLDHAMLAGANLRDADLTEVYARDTDLHGLDFSGVGKMLKARLQKSDLHGSNFRRVALAGASLEGANLDGANLLEADLSEAALQGATLRKADLRGAKLAHLSLRKADLRGADLRGASVEDVNLQDANLEGANLGRVDLAGLRINDTIWTNGCKLAEGGNARASTSTAPISATRI
jgi:uncharacterized protein YjbI with pentapeptide repeats